MKQVEWFFDFISPYSYLQCECWNRLPAELKVQCRPVLLAGLLDHWGQKGPAEIAPKRIFIYRQLQWLVEKRGIPFRFPNGHPFNPLPMLRLAVALDSDFTAIREMFRFVWRDGHLPSDQQAWSRLLNRLNVTDAETKLQSPIVKQQLRDNGKRAIELGVFGVPTFVVEGELFWGADALDFFLDYLRDPDLLSDPEMKRISNLPIAAARTLKSGR
jgi:2-hydroxychromene-2-carboxylate isomerase